MESIKKNWSYIVLIILLIVLFRQCNKEPEKIEVPIEIEVPVPVIEKEFDTITILKPFEVIKKESIIDSVFYKRYLSLKDSIARDSLFKEVIAIREYNTKVEDDTITIDTYHKVRGELLATQTSYKTKPRNIKLDTIIKIDNPQKAELYFGGEIFLPSRNPNLSPGIAPSITFINKSHKVAYDFSYDFINNNFNFGVKVRF